MIDVAAPNGHAHKGPAPNPRVTVLTFIVLAFLFSSVFWYLIAASPPLPENSSLLLLYTTCLMWCPAVAAIVTRLWFRRNLDGFGMCPGKPGEASNPHLLIMQSFIDL